MTIFNMKKISTIYTTSIIVSSYTWHHHNNILHEGNIYILHSILSHFHAHDSWYTIWFGIWIELHGIKNLMGKAMWMVIRKMWSLELGFYTWIPNPNFSLKLPFDFWTFSPAKMRVMSFFKNGTKIYNGLKIYT